jgi:hypothetical protein
MPLSPWGRGWGGVFCPRVLKNPMPNTSGVIHGNRTMLSISVSVGRVAPWIVDAVISGKVKSGEMG